jgi:hypothetical protein
MLNEYMNMPCGFVGSVSYRHVCNKVKLDKLLEDDMKVDFKDVMVWTGFSWSRWGSAVAVYGEGNDHLVSIKGGEFFDQVIFYQLLKKDSVSWHEF